VTFKRSGRDVAAVCSRVRAWGIGRTYQTPVVPEELTVAEVLKGGAPGLCKPYLTRHHAEWACELLGLNVGRRPASPAQRLETLEPPQAAAGLSADAPACTLLLLDEPAAGTDQRRRLTRSTIWCACSPRS
jgi:branched-chain amino acid transport system ATP-binding protein